MRSNEERVTTIVAEQCGISRERVAPTDTKATLGMDSLDDIELVMSIEDEFGIEIPDEEAEKWVNVGEIIAYINARVAA